MAAWVRFMAATDESAIGRLALSYLTTLVKVVPVRLVSMSGQLWGRWGAAAELLMTSMDGLCINVVCCAPERWIWRQRIEMPVRDISGDKHGALGTATNECELITGLFELHTRGMRNVLLTDVEAPMNAPRWMETARKYDALCVPRESMAKSWRDADCRPVVLQPGDQDLIREVLALT